MEVGRDGKLAEEMHAGEVFSGSRVDGFLRISLASVLSKVAGFYPCLGFTNPC